MNRLLWLFAILLVLLGPIAGVYLGIHPAILPFLGIVCGIAAVLRGAQPLPDGGGTASPGAQADAKILTNTTVNSPPNRGIGITDI